MISSSGACPLVGSCVKNSISSFTVMFDSSWTISERGVWVVKKSRIFYGKRSSLISCLACSLVRGGRLALNESIPQLASHRRIMTRYHGPLLLFLYLFYLTGILLGKLVFDIR